MATTLADEASGSRPPGWASLAIPGSQPRRVSRPGCLSPDISGYHPGMDDKIPDRTETRAELLPEEQAADSADPEAQAREVLKDSDRRTEDPEPTMRRRPEETA